MFIQGCNSLIELLSEKEAAGSQVSLNLSDE